MAFDLCVIPASVVPYLSALQTRQFSMTDITAHLVSDKLPREQCRLMTHEIFTSSYGSSSHALHVRSSVSSEINLAITSSVSGNAPSGYTIVIQGYLNDPKRHIVLGVCVSDEPIVADASLRMFVNIEETNNVFRLRADFDGMVTQGLLDDILYQSLEAYPTIALYNSSTKKITFKNASNTELPNMEIDASAFIKDGMVNDVVIQNGNLVVSFNTEAGKEDISIPLSSIFDSGNYYTKTQTDTQISNAIDALGEASRYDVDPSPIVDASSGNLVTTISMTQWVRSQIQDASDYIRSIIPSVHNATLTIKKSADVSGDTFTANASSDKTIDLDLGDAADKNVDTSIVNASSVNLPTVEAVTGWVSSQLRGYAQSSDIPTVGNATITIQKRSGTSAGDFTTNATADKTINLSLGAAADKEVDTSISSTSSINLPTSSAVAEWVNAQTGNFVTLDTQQTITSPKMLSSGEFSTSLNISNIVVEQVPSSTSEHTSSATLTSDGLYADGVSFKNAYGRAADNFLVASVSGNSGYSELAVLGGNGFTFSYKGTNETDSHYPLRISAGSTTFDENQTLYLAKDTNTYLHVDNTTLSVKDYVERIAGSGSSKFVVANVNTPYPSGDNFKDNRPPGTPSTSGTSSDNPHYNSKNASFMFDVSELPSNGTTFEVFMPSTTFVGSVQLVYGSLNYIYPIYFRGNDNVHCPTVPQGSVLRITFYENAFYGDFYDLADFGDEHEAYVYVGKVPVDKSGSDLYAFSGLVGIDRDTGKFSQLFKVTVTDNGAGVISPRLKENSPIYACFQGDCFAAHPKVPFGNILRIYDVYGQGTLSTNMLPFTYYPFDVGDTVDAHVVTNTSSPSSQVAYKYFQVDNCPVYIQVESNRVLIGNPPADIPARLIGFMCSGAENAGMIRLVESSDVSYMSDDNYSKTFAGVWDDNSVDTSLSYMSDNVLVGLSKSSSKLVPLLVDDACNGDVTINPNLDWDSPVYVLFKNFRCFSAHPMVDFRQVLKYDNNNNSFMFTFSPMGSVGSETPSFADVNQYFGSANYPVFISDFHGSNSGYKSFCVGIPSDVNIPSYDLHWRLLGYTTSKPGYIRLTESHPFLKDFIHQTGGYVKLSEFTDILHDASCGDVTPSQYVEHFKASDGLQVAVQKLVSNYGEPVFHIKDLDASSVSSSALESNGEVYVLLPSMTTVEFTDRVSFRTSKGEAAYIDSYGVYHGRALGAETADTATRSSYATELNVSSGVSTIASFKYGSSTWDTDKGINPTTSNTLSLGSTSNVWKDVYGYTLHAWGNSASSGLRLCDGNYESEAYSSITGYQDSINGLMKFHHYNASNGIDYVVTSTGPNTTDTSATAATLTTVPQSTGTWTVGSSTYKLAAVYANTFYGNLSGNADTATNATSATYATNLRYSSTNVLTAAGTSTVTSVATIRPETSGAVSLGTSSYKWNYIYANYGKFSTSLATDGTLTVTGASTLSGGLSLSMGASLSGEIVINDTLYFGSGKTVKMNLYESGIDVKGHLTPVSSNTYDLGSASYPWDRLYVNYITGTGVAKSIAGYGNGTSQNSSYPVGSLILVQITTATYPSGTQLPNNKLANPNEFGDMPASKIRKVSLYASGNQGNVTCWQNSGAVLSGTWRVVGDVWSSNVTSYPPVVLAVRIA